MRDEQIRHRLTHGVGPIRTLAAYVVKSALADEGPEYALTEDGRFWCDVMGLDAERVAWLAAKDS